MNNVEVDFDQIKSHTKESFKRLVKEHVNATAFEYLKNVQQNHSKARPLQYETFKMQEYLGSESKLSSKEKAITFALRTRMIDLKSNFGERDEVEQHREESNQDKNYEC